MKEEISLLEIFMVLKRRAFQITIWSCAGLLVAVLYPAFPEIYNEDFVET